AGVDTRDAADAVPEQEVLEITVAAPARAAAGQLADDHAAAERPPGLEVRGRDAVVADVGVREGDDLARVAGVGDDLLVAGEHRVEHDLASRDASGRLRSDQLALEHRPVGED